VGDIAGGGCVGNFLAGGRYLGWIGWSIFGHAPLLSTQQPGPKKKKVCYDKSLLREKSVKRKVW